MEAVDLAATLLDEMRQEESSKEAKRQKELAKLVQDSQGKQFLTLLMDQCFRSSSAKREIDQILHLINRYGSPPLKLLKWILPVLPEQSLKFFKKYIRRETDALVMPGETKELLEHIQKRLKEGARVNLNRLGEAILGEEEAERRLQEYLEDLSHPEIDYISVKISSLYSQINLIAWDETLEVLKSRFRKLLRSGKFINLDMEESKDLDLTVALFRETLDEPEFVNHTAGIVLQAYLPESYTIQVELTQWALKRVGAPIKIRIVKGANLAMEKVEASLKGWPQAPYQIKEETDANFIRMLLYGFGYTHVVKIGLGSHNLFDIALAYDKNVTFEMLEGMNDALRRVLNRQGKDVLLYCPVAKEEEFQYAIAYLVRRFDENTAPENFLRNLFDLKVGTDVWQEEVSRFLSAYENRHSVSSQSRRTQRKYVSRGFVNEPDTDFSLAPNREWAHKWLNDQMPISVVGSEVEWHAEWKSEPHERIQLMRQVAVQLRKKRGELISAMIRNTHKTFMEADTEVSEAIDFAQYYALQLEEFLQLEDVRFSPKGLTLIAPPWNFPCSIPAGGIIASLIAGNPVLFKPAQEATWVGQVLVEAFWEAGVDKKALQFVPCPDEPDGSQLVQDERVKLILLTGSSETARHLMKLQSGFKVMGETGGKNAIIVSDIADHDLAIKDIVQSAFGYSGQKCSACSLVILLKEVYDNPRFKKQLQDAVRSLKVGSPLEPGSKVIPLISRPKPSLLRALTTLEEGEEWWVEPRQLSDTLVSPGVKAGVKPGSFTHQTEFFGPVLGIMCAENIAQAIEWVNLTPYGLTSGLHSLDDREIVYWKDHIQAGNLYVNRGITGAIVERQPFGGCKESQYGISMKAGGPNYLLPLMHIEQIKGENTYALYWEHYFSKTLDPQGLHGQQNLFYYVPHSKIYLRVQEGDLTSDIELCKEAARICATPLQISREETEEEFIDQLPERARVRLFKMPSPYLIQALNAKGASVHVARPLLNGRLELIHYLREVSLSYDYHRYGYAVPLNLLRF